jgi:hypothetical protein
MSTIKIVRKTPTNSTIRVYDFTVDGDHHYILSNGVISHNSYVPMKEMSGGHGLKFAASTIIYLSKKKDRVDNEVVGSIIHCKTYKSRLTKQDKMVDVQLNFEKGLNKYYGLLEIAIKHGVFKKVSNKVQLPDGKTAFESQINKNPEKYYTEDVLKAIDAAARREFCYGGDEPKPEETTDGD